MRLADVVVAAVMKVRSLRLRLVLPEAVPVALLGRLVVDHQ